jgi:hypothetical protein
MPARITIKAELQNLLNKAQALTDANRLSQLEGERRRRAEREQLAAKKVKAEEEERRRRALDDPTMRNIRTAAMGQQQQLGIGAAWIDISNEGRQHEVTMQDQSASASYSLDASPQGFGERSTVISGSDPGWLEFPNAPYEPLLYSYVAPWGGNEWYPGDPLLGLLGSTTIRPTLAREYDYVSSFVDEYIFAAPLKGNAFVYCHWKRTTYSRLSGRTVGTTVTATFVPTGETVILRVPSFGVPPEYEVVTPIEEDAEVPRYQYIPTFSKYKNELQQSGKQELLETHCFIATGSSIREIDMPANLGSILEAIAPTYTLSPLVVSGDEDTGFRVDAVPILTKVASPYITPQSGPLTTFGSNSSFTPGLYSVLRSPPKTNTTAIQTANWTQESGRAILRAALDGPPPTQLIASCQLPGTCTATKLGFDVANYSATNPLFFGRKQALDVILPSANELPTMTVWDWGQPDYCRQQLLALGFSPADLVP